MRTLPKLLGRVLVAISLGIAGCGSDDPAPGPSDDAASAEGFKAQLERLCTDLGTQIEDRTDDEGVLQDVAGFHEQLEGLNPPDEVASGFEEFSSAVERSFLASRDQLEATEARRLEDALAARAEAAEAKMDIYEAVEEHSLPESCKGDTLDSLEARVIAGRADLICFDFAERFLQLLQSVQGRSLTGEFIGRESVPMWRNFVDELQAVVPEGQAGPSAQRMVRDYDAAADALLDLADALRQRDERLGKQAQRKYYTAIERADRIAESVGITQCSQILGLGQANSQDA